MIPKNNNKNKNNDIRKIMRGFPPHIKLEHGLKGIAFVGIHMQPICNFRCKKCFIGEMSSKKNSNALSMKEIEKFLKNSKKAGAKVLGLTGLGEPLMDRKINEVISLANKLGFLIHLVTNGSLLTRKKLEFLKNNNVTLMISFDTLDSKMFAELSGTSERMFEKVKTNLKLAQEVFKGTAKVKQIGKSKVKIFRLGVHSTISEDNVDQIEKIEGLLNPEVTFFSVSPLADIASASENQLKIAETLSKQLSEKHLVVVDNPKTGKGICGFFNFGLDLNFDGEILLDAHAIESRNLLSNIRDFDFDVKQAFDQTKKVKQDFVNRFLEGFCPVRSPKINLFLQEKKKEKELKKKIIQAIKDKECLLKFAYIREGASKFIKVMDSPEYLTARREIELIEKNRHLIENFIGENDLVILGAGDGRKLKTFIHKGRKTKIIDLSPEMIALSKNRLVSGPEFVEADFEKIDFKKFNEGSVFVILGNTLGNVSNIEHFLSKIKGVKNAKMILGVELLKKVDDKIIKKIVEAYDNETGFQFIFTPLELLGIKRKHGIIKVKFNETLGRIEEFFEFKDPVALNNLARESKFPENHLKRIFLSVSSKLTQKGFNSLLEEKGFKIEKKFRKGTNFIFYLVSNT